MKNKEKTLFFLTIVRNKEDSALYKYFFSNIDPSSEESAKKKVQKSLSCHIIANDNPEKSPHVLFQLLGWQASGNEQLTPISIHPNRPVCPTCHAILFQLIGVDVATNEKGCCGDDFPAFDKIPAMAQKYINSHLTLSLAEKILAPLGQDDHKEEVQALEDQLKEVRQETEQKDQQLNEKDNQINQLRQQIDALKQEFRNQPKAKNQELQQKNNQLAAKDNQIEQLNEEKEVFIEKENKTVRIWSAKTGKEVRQCLGHNGGVNSVSWSHDDAHLATASSDWTVRIWDAKTGK